MKIHVYRLDTPLKTIMNSSRTTNGASRYIDMEIVFFPKTQIISETALKGLLKKP